MQSPWEPCWPRDAGGRGSGCVPGPAPTGRRPSAPWPGDPDAQFRLRHAQPPSPAPRPRTPRAGLRVSDTAHPGARPSARPGNPQRRRDTLYTGGPDILWQPPGPHIRSQTYTCQGAPARGGRHHCAGGPSATSARLRTRLSPVATRPRRMPGCSRAMAVCSRCRTPVCRGVRRNAGSCNNGCADTGNRPA